MNAYELAKGLDQFSDLGGDFFGKCANVLRQQATLIDYYKVRDDSHIKIIKAQADRIAELEKGEEVAGRFYWESVVDGHVMAVPSEGTPHYNKDDFPLYTTPQIKELSDEEIIEIGNAVVNLIDSNEGWIEFAKAILKKASEK
jgi:recombinational DNA repair protein RecR